MLAIRLKRVIRVIINKNIPMITKNKEEVRELMIDNQELENKLLEIEKKADLVKEMRLREIP